MTDPALAHRITHRHIEVFRAVMTAGSATGAADLLHSSQPTVSRELARLESLLGYALFERIQGRLRANARALALWDEVQRSWQGLERVVDRAVALCRAGAVLLRTLDEVSLLPASHALALQPVLQLADFADQPFVSLSADDPYRRIIDARFAEAAVPRTLRMETHSAAAVCAMVEHGLGLAIVNPLTALTAAANGRLVVRRLALSIPFSVAAVLPLYRPPLPEVAPMLEALRAEAAEVARRLEAVA